MAARLGLNMKLQGEEAPQPNGDPALCPRCRQAVDVRCYPDIGELWMDCWRCHFTWNVSQRIADS